MQENLAAKSQLLLNQLSSATEPLMVAGVYDTLTGLLAQKCGCEALWLSGFCVSASLGLVDDESLPICEFVDVARRIASRVRIPMICDAGIGFADPIHTVCQLFSAGVAAVCIEDGAPPKVNGLIKPSACRIRSKREMSELYRTIIATTKLNGILIARTDALLAGETTSEVINRVQEYAKAGVEVAIIHSSTIDGRDALVVARAVADVIRVGVIPTTFVDVPLIRLSEAGVRFAIYANQILRVSVAASDRLLCSMLEERRLSTSEFGSLATMQSIDELVRMP